ncbi:MAG: hypothetical protein ETSY2_45060 [Candidatus Entotheonella gemina]|uniref:Uncharacterized protein n=1 Tax=Candidatus Entotheonella gemina TaxID=1429439 RepID=W4LGQ4_9BACT|nr:MAG: hypothetical protein ETSY2_45060 [Candidatus Entotheonella gemina]
MTAHTTFFILAPMALGLLICGIVLLVLPAPRNSLR